MHADGKDEGLPEGIDRFRFGRCLAFLAAQGVDIAPNSGWLDLGCNQGQFLRMLVRRQRWGKGDSQSRQQEEGRSHRPLNNPPRMPRTIPPTTLDPAPRELPNTCLLISLATWRPMAEDAERAAEVAALFQGELAASRSA